MRPARRLLGPALGALLVTVAAGCGGGDTATPVACFEGAGAYLKALAGAPRETELAAGTAISDCLAEDQDAGELTQVGEALVTAATRLNAEARRDPGGRANFELGYLLGAVERGAEHTQGIHSDLLRRLTVAARFAPGKEPLTPAFLATYRRGFDAGREGG